MTLAISIGFSALLALTLTPALCATLLKPHDRSRSAAGNRGGRHRAFLRRLQRLVRPHHLTYQSGVGQILARPLRFLAVFVVLVAFTVLVFRRLPGSFLPAEDQGYVITVVQAPPGSTTERTNEAIEQVRRYTAQPQVEDSRVRPRLQLLRPGTGECDGVRLAQSVGRAAGDKNSADTLVGKAMGVLSKVKQAMVFTLNPPSIPELGVASGFTFKLQDRAGPRCTRCWLLAISCSAPLARARAHRRSSGRQEDAPNSGCRSIASRRAHSGCRSRRERDARDLVRQRVRERLQREGRILRVMLAGGRAISMTPQDMLNLRVRNAQGEMVPFGAFTRSSGRRDRRRSSATTAIPR